LVTIDEAGGDRIAGDREHDRHRAGRLQQRSDGPAAMRGSIRNPLFR